MQGRRALSVIFVCLHMKTPRQQMATPQRSRTERSLPSVPSEFRMLPVRRTFCGGLDAHLLFAVGAK